jgi:dienelactone hydrolase
MLIFLSGTVFPQHIRAQGLLWPDTSLHEPPAFTWIDSLGPDYSLRYENVPYQGSMAEVFAYYSVPESHDGDLPAMVLVHGGAGQAFQNWAQQWAGWGYAAIAMDLNGNDVPYGRPWGSDVFTIGEIIPLKDTWYYHAPSAVIRAISWLRNRPEIYTSKIGVMGISWGGWTTNIVMGVEKRIAFAIPVYGTGFIYENSAWSPISSPSYVDYLDPANYVSSTSVPTYWISGLDDPFYSAMSRRKCYRSTKSHYTITHWPSYTHNYDTPWNTPEIRRFADSFCKDGPPLMKIAVLEWGQGQIRAVYQAEVGLQEASLVYTMDTSPWDMHPWEEPSNVEWLTDAASIDTVQHVISADVPQDATAYYLMITDEYDHQVSTDFIDAIADPEEGNITYEEPVTVNTLPRHKIVPLRIPEDPEATVKIYSVNGRISRIKQKNDIPEKIHVPFGIYIWR